MTIAQISAIIGLLVAFNAPQSTVAKVQSILTNAQEPVQTTVQSIPQIPVFGSVATSTCNPVPVVKLTFYPTKRSQPRFTGSYTTGCDIDPNTPFSFSVFKMNGEELGSTWGTFSQVLVGTKGDRGGQLETSWSGNEFIGGLDFTPSEPIKVVLKVGDETALATATPVGSQ